MVVHFDSEHRDECICFTMAYGFFFFADKPIFFFFLPKIRFKKM